MKKLTKNIAHQYGLEVAKYAFPFVTVPYLTRVLGPDIYAVRAYVMAAMAFATAFLDFGFNSHGTRVVALARGDVAEESRATTSITIARLALCAIGAPALAAVSMGIPLLAENAAYVAVAYAGACMTALLPDFVFKGQQDMGIITRRFVGSKAAAVALTFLLVRGPDQLLLVPALESLASLIALIWSWANVLLRRGIRPRRVEATRVLRDFRESAVYFVSNASTTVFTALTTLMIGALVEDAAQVSYWSLAMSVVAVLQALYSPISSSLYPHMCLERDFPLVGRFLLAGTPLAVAGTAAYVLLADYVMLFLGGADYVAGSWVVVMTAPVVALSYPAILLGYPVMAACGRSRLLTATSLASAAFHVAGLCALAAAGAFTVANVAVLRCLTEGVLMAGRAAGAWSCYRDEGR